MPSAAASPHHHLSISSLVSLRSQGQCRSHVFLNRVREQQSIKYLSRMQRIHSLDKSIRSLDVHPNEPHFLLAGSREGIVSVYDLSNYGTENRSFTTTTTTGGVQIHKPIARSVATVTTDDGTAGEASETSSIRLGSVICTRWYPADSGAFVTAHATGSLTIWDTNAMSLAARIVPFAPEAAAAAAATAAGVAMATSSASSTSSLLSTMEISPLSHDLVAVGSCKFPTVKLVDIRSGACSHSLTGHRRGITTVQWSPTCEHVLASGCVDGCIRLWDIRKAGRNGWIMDCLDKDFQPPDMSVSRLYRPDYSHLKRHMERRNGVSAIVRGKRRKIAAGPNDYQSVATRQGSRSHDDAIGALAFDPSGHWLVSNGTEGMLKLWDLRGEGHLVPRRFQRTAASTQLQVVHDGGGGGGGGHRGMSLSISPASSLPTMTTIWATYGSTLRSYALEEGGTTPRQELVGHLKSVQAIKYIADTGEIVTGGADGVILLWTPASSATARSSSSSSSKSAHSSRARNVADQNKQTRDVDFDSW